MPLNVYCLRMFHEVAHIIHNTPQGAGSKNSLTATLAYCQHRYIIYYAFNSHEAIALLMQQVQGWK